MNSSFNSSWNKSFNTSSMLNTSRRQKDDAFILSANSHHCLQSYGEKLPSMIKSVVNNFQQTSSDSSKNQKISCRLDPNGWAWMVCGRRLYIWRHSYLDDVKRSTTACRELILPPSELVHSAQLVCIVANTNFSSTGAPSCIAVSPEGHITYWPNISNESATFTINADIPGGQECDTLTSLWPTGCILTTTSATVLYIKPIPGGGKKASLSCVPLYVQKGWFGGLTRKVTSILFTPISATSALDMKRAKIVIPISKDEPSFPGNKSPPVYVLVGQNVQTWSVNSEIQNCLNEVDFENLIREHFYNKVQAFQNQERKDIRGLQIWILDITTYLLNDNTHIALLVAGLNQGDNLIYYGIISFHSKNPYANAFKLVDFNSQYNYNENFIEEQLNCWKLYFTHDYFYMLSPDQLLIIGDSTIDSMNPLASDGYFLGSGVVNGNTLLVFVPRIGVGAIHATGSASKMNLDTSWMDVRVPDHLALSINQQNLENLSTSEDSVNRYKSAFLSFLTKKNEDCQEILTSLFPYGTANLAPKSPIDIWTVALCEKLIDDAPVSDPRWGNKFDGENTKIRSKMLIKNFLLDKKEGVELFFGFLKTMQILDRLATVLLRENEVSSVSQLYNCYEKIGFSMALHGLQNESKFRLLVDNAIKSVVLIRYKNEDPTRAMNISSNDIFFKDVSRVQDIIPALVSIEEEYINSEAAVDVTQHVQQVTELILRSFSDMITLHLVDKLELVYETLIQPIINGGKRLEILPWTIESTTLSSLINQHKIVSNIIFKINNDNNDNLSKVSDLLKLLQQLTDLILDGLRMNLESIKNSERYREVLRRFEETRFKLLKTFVASNDFEGAFALAEKYLDFQVLVALCYDRKDFTQLEVYINNYANMNFAEFVFDWYIKQKKSSELIDTFSKNPLVGPKLNKFLEQYPQIQWHHSAVNQDYQSTYITLKDLAEKEEFSVDNKKFLLCLTKLSYLATKNDDFLPNEPLDSVIIDIRKEMDIIEYQNQLKDNSLQAFGLERSTMRTLTPAEIIDVLTHSDDNVQPDPIDFAKALPLCDFLANDDIRKEKRYQIVGLAILKDPWDTYPTDHPEDVIETSLIAKFVIKALKLNGEELEDLIPDEILDLPILENLMENTNAKFLIQACFEYLKTQKDTLLANDPDYEGGSVFENKQQSTFLDEPVPMEY